jgi:hypothetical protein
MYKKITHTIVEEHYDHPSILPDDMNCDTTTPVYYSNNRKAMVSVADPEATQIIKDSLNNWGQLCWRLRSLVISITEGDKDIDLLKTRLTGDVGELAKIVERVYGMDAANKFKELVLNITTTLVDIITSIRADSETLTNKLKTKLTDEISELGGFLGNANAAWPASAVKSIFSTFTDLYIQQALNRIAKQWSAGVEAADKAYNLMVVKQPTGGPSFADIFANGLISAKK